MSVILLVFSILSSSCQVEAKEFPGVYKLELLDFNGKTISKATGFKIRIKDEYGFSKRVIVTSFHFLNARLLEAEGIRINDKVGGKAGEAFSILAYDELNDLLVLNYKGEISENDSVKEDMALTAECEGNMNVLGYHNDDLHLLSFNSSDVQTVGSMQGLIKVPVYLKKGFSGAPILNNDAAVCGMVALSSEMNANSIALTSKLIYRIIKDKGFKEKGISIGEVRREMKLEFPVKNKTELTALLSSRTEPVVVVIENGFDSNELKIVNARNVIIKNNFSENLKMEFVRSDNLKIEGVSPRNITLNNCSNMSLLFENQEKTY